ncbi:MAG: hypothetical protein ACLGPL_00015 [Acidobacteriota bacterium]
MKRIVLVLFFVLALQVSNGFCASSDKIELTDGSVINGEILSFDGRKYRIQTPSMGVIEVDKSNMSAIRSQDGKAIVSATPAKPSGAAPAASSDIDTIKQMILSDPDTLEKIATLRNDPDFQAVLQDPNLLRSIQAGDVSALTADPRFMRLFNNSVVQDIGGKMAR